MKKLFFSLVCIASFVASWSQVPISSMPTRTGNPNGAWVPIVIGSTNYKTDAANFGWDKMDSAYVRNDSIFGSNKRHAHEFFIGKLSTGIGGSTNTNIGSGYSLAVEGTNGIKTFFAGAGIVIDSTINPNALTFSIDTSLINFSGDTTIVNNFVTNKSILIPRTDTVNAKQKNGSIIFDTIANHYYGYVDGDWFCLDCTGVSSVAWGEITGTLSDQTDLQTALNLKLNISDTSSMLSTYLRTAGDLSPLFSTTESSHNIAFAQQNTTQYTVLGRIASGSGAYSFVTADSTLIQGFHTEAYYNTKYLIHDSDAYHTVTAFADSTGFSLNRPNGTKDSIHFLAGATYTASNGMVLSGTNFKWGTNPLVENTTITGAGFYSRFSGGRLEAGKGADIAAANDLTLGNDGNMFGITGSTQINAITTTNWQAGSEVSLVFASTPTVKHNTTGGAGTAKILLAGGIDYVAAANDVLVLKYDGTVWHEVSRKLSSSGTSAQLTATAIGYGGAGNLLTGTADSLNYTASSRLIQSYNSFSGGSSPTAGMMAFNVINNQATVGTSQDNNGPFIGSIGHAWKSNATAIDQWGGFFMRASPTTGATNINPAGEFWLGSSSTLAAIAPSQRLGLWNATQLTVIGSVASQVAGNGTFLGSNLDATTTSGTGVNIISSNASGGKIHFKFAGQEVGKWFQSTGTFIIQNYGTIPADPADGTQFVAFQNGSYTGVGTVTGSSGSAALTGTGTKFTNQYQVGDQMAIQGAGAETKTIATITDDTHLTFTSNMASGHTNVAHTVTPAITKKFNLFQNGKLSMNGPIVFASTITAGGTTGNQTIDKPSGTVNIAAGNSSVTVTNSFVSASSIVYAVVRTNDGTAYVKNVVPSAGSFVITLGAAATGETSVGFVVFNY